MSSLAVAQAPGQTALPSPEIYTCIDAHGRKLTSDRPIAACRDREQKILNPSGTVKARVGPTLTAKEQAQRDAKARADLAERTRIEEERRQDRALLIRYPNPAAHEKERAEALDNINRSKQTALTRTTELLAQRSKLTDEMAFYEKDPSKAPPQLQHQYQEVNQALAVQGRLLAEFDAQLIRIKTRFDTELNRLIPLWNQVSKSID
ncbi:MAG: DUF4124 domain-containing protein [Comamonadaceae bacterium CG2_30_60_41]|nr:MAG: DUF4124 domain-containing protein [Comamonadaceae bacterium CG2_30_60_41]